MTGDPHAEYGRRLAQRRAEAEKYARAAGMLANARLIVFLLAVAAVWLCFAPPGRLAPGWLVVPLLAFALLVARHNHAKRLCRLAGRAAAFYERGIERQEDRWAGTGLTGERFADLSHPYSGDLDLFGRGSLFELLCTARTQAGEECLAGWLRAPAAPEAVRARQVAVAELAPRLDLREDLALLGEDVRSALPGEALAAWGAAPAVFPPPSRRRLRLAAVLLAGIGALSLAGWAAGWGPLPFVIGAALGQAFAAALHRRTQPIVRAAGKRSRDLALFSVLLARLERERFDAPALQALRAALDAAGKPPSVRIARLQTLVDLLHSQHNALFAPLAALLLWTTQIALAIDAWRAENGPEIERWLRTVGEFEALCALAGYAYEHPADPFPEIAEKGACFEAEDLGHPLLPDARSVRNDVRLGADLPLLLVSGSNMSGKSTLLRTVGVNAVLALAGAPVRARRLRLAPLCIGASLRTQDSLQAGVSRFYAEITRLRQIVELTEGALPLLFLLDEILHGTNSHDRRIGAEAIVRALLRRGALGLVTTHDLALTHIADAINVHFEDHLENGVMTFDYRLRPGVVEKSNALALMRAVGLEV